MKFLLLTLFFSSQIFAYSLKNLAVTSNIILVLSDRLSTQAKATTCGYLNDDISMLSQKLKIEVDAKIITMEDSDYKLVQTRAKSCHLDCSCDIYALALEKKDIKNEELAKKSAEITMKDRIKCLSQIKNICENKILKTFKK